jgi:hypothetical protein
MVTRGAGVGAATGSVVPPHPVSNRSPHVPAKTDLTALIGDFLADVPDIA